MELAPGEKVTTPEPIYYECHITISPLTTLHQRAVAQRDCCTPFKFKVAELMMQKKDPHKLDSFITGHGKDYDELMIRGKEVCKALEQAGAEIWRFKIEAVLYDERMKPAT
jgi:hypothetical protein